jgi:hypothetical protein
MLNYLACCWTSKLYTEKFNQWEFQDPKMEVRKWTIFLAIFCEIFPYIGLKNWTQDHIFWGYSLKNRPEK